MWFLLIVFLAMPAHPIILERYANEQDCQDERNRIGRDMADSYPYVHDFDIVCRYWGAAI